MSFAARSLTRSALRGAAVPRASSSAVLPQRLASRTLTSSAQRLAVSTRFTKEHEWVRFDDATNIGTVGITEYAQNSLGDVVFVEISATGQEVEKGKEIGAVESVKAASDIYAPVTGTVESVNERLQDEPSLVNKSPEDEGWLCTIKLTNPNEFETLLSDEAYKALVDEADH